MKEPGQFIVATPSRSVCDAYARILARHGRLRAYCLGTRRGTPGIPADRTRLFPLIGLLGYGAARILSPQAAESFRFGLHPLFDRWAERRLAPGDHVISSYGYANRTFRRARQAGGKTFLDAGNSHPRQFWELIQEEHRRWKVDRPPIALHQYDRSLAMMEETDYALSPSTYVTQSFLRHGMAAERILPIHYPIDFSHFFPAPEPRPPARPFTLVNTGSLSLRKGTPYLLEAFRLIQRADPKARLFLSRIVEDSMKAILPQYRDLNIEWASPLPPSAVGERLRQADLFILPSLEDGWANTVSEALSCGLPAIVTPHTGACDAIRSGINGEVVPIRSPQEIAAAALRWRERVLAPAPRVPLIDREAFSAGRLEEVFLGHLRRIGLLTG